MRQPASESAAQERQIAESELVEIGFALRNRRIGDLMQPRAAMLWLDADRPIDEVWQRIAVADQDAFLVCRGGLDNVLGVIGSRQIRSAFAAEGRLNLMGCLREPLHLPRTMRLLAALEAMRLTRAELALVVDEDGSDLGMVTERGLLDVLAGEVLSGLRPAQAESIRRSDGSWLLDGMLPIADFRMLLGRNPATDREALAYRTLAGLVMTRLGRVPAAGDALEWEGLRIEVIDLDGRRIDKLLVTPVA